MRHLEYTFDDNKRLDCEFPQVSKLIHCLIIIIICDYKWCNNLYLGMLILSFSPTSTCLYNIYHQIDIGCARSYHASLQFGTKR